MVKPYYEEKGITLYQGDCRSVLPTLDDCSVDAVVTDPPYELGFMGKGWDRSGIAYDVDVWRECLRVLKPGGHLLAFGGSRTYHRLACAIEDAGFEIRDQIQWLYGSGFPKSLDVSKAIDAAAGAERGLVGVNPYSSRRPQTAVKEGVFANKGPNLGGPGSCDVTAPATVAAKQWSGWGTALKPAHEPIVLARKPLIGTVAENVLKHGTGGLNIDGCRIETEASDPNIRTNPTRSNGLNSCFGVGDVEYARGPKSEGRWPANVIHDGSEEVLAGFPKTISGSGIKNPVGGALTWKKGSNWRDSGEYEGDSGSAARFFYCAKASKKDRNEGCEDLPQRKYSEANMTSRAEREARGERQDATARNHHPTVKPTELMQYLCRLITPPGGTVLDPFGGSGSTAKAALLEGFNCILIEKEIEYCEIAERRIQAAQNGQPQLAFEAVA